MPSLGTLSPILEPLGGMPWERAKAIHEGASLPLGRDLGEEMCVHPPSPSPGEVRVYEEKCLDHFTPELKSLIRRTEHLFYTHVQHGNDFTLSINFFKRTLSNREFDSSDLSFALSRLDEAVSMEAIGELNASEAGALIEEAQRRLGFLENLFARLPTSIFSWSNKERIGKVEELKQRISALKALQAAIGEAYNIHSIASSFDNIMIRRSALSEKIKRLDKTKGRLQIETENEFRNLERDFERLRRRVEEVHLRFPGLFASLFAELEEEMTRDHDLLHTLICRRNPQADVKDYLKGVLSRITFTDLLNPNSLTVLFLTTIYYIYLQHHETMEFAEEYAFTFAIMERARSYIRVLNHLKNLDYLKIKTDDLELLSTLDEREIAPLRKLLTTQALSHFTNRTPQMKKRLISHFRAMFRICPHLAIPKLVQTLNKMDASLASLPRVNHRAHKIDLNDELRRLLLWRMRQLIDQNRLSDLSWDDWVTFKNELGPNYPYFQNLIIESFDELLAQYNEGIVTLSYFSSHIGHLQAILDLCPRLADGGRIQDRIRDALYHARDSYKLSKHLDSHHVRLQMRVDVCSNCIKEKIKFDQLEKLTYGEVDRLYYHSTDQEAFRTRLQQLLDTKTPSELKLYKEDHLDPLINNVDFAGLKRLDCVHAFLRVVEARNNPPSFFAWLSLIFQELLRMLGLGKYTH